jgi:hypothetical protein
VRQKINILHDHLGLAWSGNFLAAYTLARKLKQHINDHTLSTEGIARITKENGDDLACILLVLEGQQTNYLWQNAQSVQLTQFNHVRFAGSGSDYFIKIIKALDASKPVSHAPEAFHPIGTALTIASQCVGREMFTLNTLLESWGGAIEICFPVAGKLQKLDNVAFLQVIYDADEPFKDFAFAPRVLLNRYHADTLVCRAITFKASGGSNAEELLVDSDEVSLIEPLLKCSTPIIKSSASEFEYDYLCTCLRYRNRQKNRSWSESFVDACPGKISPRPLKIRLDGQNATVVITDGLKDRLRAAVLAFEQEEKAL